MLCFYDIFGLILSGVHSSSGWSGASRETNTRRRRHRPPRRGNAWSRDHPCRTACSDAPQWYDHGGCRCRTPALLGTPRAHDRSLRTHHRCGQRCRAGGRRCHTSAAWGTPRRRGCHCRSRTRAPLWHGCARRSRTSAARWQGPRSARDERLAWEPSTVTPHTIQAHNCLCRYSRCPACDPCPCPYPWLRPCCCFLETLE